MENSKVKLAIFSFAILATSFGCESKFKESSPDAVAVQGRSLDDRIEQKTKIDVRLDEVQKSAEKINSIISMIKKVQAPDINTSVYTPLDFLMDMNNGIKTSLPEKNSESQVRYGKITLPIEALSEECRHVETKMEAISIYEDAASTKQVGEKLAYSLKTCKSDGKFVQITEAQWLGKELSFNFDTKNLDNIFSDIKLSDLLKNPTCKIKQDNNKIIQDINCQNFNVNLSASERAHVNTMSFHNSGEIRFEAQADILENDVIKATSQIKVLTNGEVKLETKNVKAAGVK